MTAQLKFMKKTHIDEFLRHANYISMKWSKKVRKRERGRRGREEATTTAPYNFGRRSHSVL